MTRYYRNFTSLSQFNSVLVLKVELRWIKKVTHEFFWRYAESHNGGDCPGCVPASRDDAAIRLYNNDFKTIGN
jgi:hypothetical protein